MRSVSSCSGLLCLLVTATVFAQPQSPAERGPMTETIKGTLKEIQEKGRSRTLIVTDDTGKEHTIPLTPKLNFQIEAPGEPGLIQPGKFVSGTGTLTNEQIFVSELKVYFLAPGQKPPVGGVKKAARMVGASVNSYDLAGVVADTAQSPDYPEYRMLALKVPGRVPTIMLEKNLTVNVVSFDTSMAKPGTAIELEVQPLKAGRFNILKATAKLDEVISAPAAAGDEGKDGSPEEKQKKPAPETQKK